MMRLMPSDRPLPRLSPKERMWAPSLGTLGVKVLAAFHAQTEAPCPENGYRVVNTVGSMKAWRVAGSPITKEAS